MRPFSSRGSSRAVPVCHTIMSIAPPLRRTFALRFGRSRSSTSSRSTSADRAAVSYSIRHSVRSRIAMSSRVSSRSTSARDSARDRSGALRRRRSSRAGSSASPALIHPVPRGGAERVERHVPPRRRPLAPPRAEPRGDGAAAAARPRRCPRRTPRRARAGCRSTPGASRRSPGRRAWPGRRPMASASVAVSRRASDERSPSRWPLVRYRRKSGRFGVVPDGFRRWSLFVVPQKMRTFLR